MIELRNIGGARIGVFLDRMVSANARSVSVILVNLAWIFNHVEVILPGLVSQDPKKQEDLPVWQAMPPLDRRVIVAHRHRSLGVSP